MIHHDDMDTCKRGYPGGWNLSRAAIQETLMAKRAGNGSALVQLGIRALRETRLTSHVEKHMVANRYRMKQLVKRAPSDICDICLQPIDYSAYIRHADSTYAQVLIDNSYCLCESCLEKMLIALDNEEPSFAVVFVNEDVDVVWVAGPNKPVKDFRVASYYAMADGSEEERRSFLFTLLCAFHPGMSMLKQTLAQL